MRRYTYETDTAVFIRRVLRYGEFNTRAKRMGVVIRASQARITVWRLHANKEITYNWKD